MRSIEEQDVEKHESVYEDIPIATKTLLTKTH